MRKLLLLLALALAPALSAPTAWAQAANPAPAAPKPVKPEAKAGQEGGGKSGEKPAPDRYITLDPLLVSVIRHEDVHKLVSFLVTVEVSDPSKRSDVEEQMPRLRDAYLTDLTRVFAFGLYDNRSVDLPLIKRRLLAVSQKVMGQGVVDDVLIMNVIERAL